MSQARVVLEVYDLSNGMAAAMSQQFLGQKIDGIWHTGIVVFNREYYFGGGIQIAPIGKFAREHNLPPVQSLDMGTTTKTQADLEAYLGIIRSQYTQETYDLIRNNCNNFSETVCQFLTGHGIPTHIVDLPRIVFSTPMGAMLRPMIEGMQNNIQQSGGGMSGGLDPFGAGRMAAPAFAGGETGFAASGAGQALGGGVSRPTPVQVAAPAPAAAAAAAPVAVAVPSSATLEDCALVSGDISTVQVMCEKIINVAGPDGVKGSGLSEEEKAVITRIGHTLQSKATVTDDRKENVGSLAAHAIHLQGPFGVLAYTTVESIMERFPALQMACLFVLRLMVLRDDHPAAVYAGLVRAVVGRLQAAVAATGTASPAFSGLPAHVMALCTLSNLISHEAGLRFVFKGAASGLTIGSAVAEEATDSAFNTSMTKEPTAAAAAATTTTAQSASSYSTAGGGSGAQLICDIIDVATGSLGHARAEVRQIAATIAYNIALSCAPSHRAAQELWDRVAAAASTHSGSSADEDELHQHIVQIMCSCVECAVREQVPAVRKRELATVCSVLRSYGRPAAQLLEDLGATEVSPDAASAPSAETTIVETIADLRLKLLREAQTRGSRAVGTDDELTIVEEILRIVSTKA